jgi:soluble lytic murein transglycosylase
MIRTLLFFLPILAAGIDSTDDHRLQGVAGVPASDDGQTLVGDRGAVTTGRKTGSPMGVASQESARDSARAEMARGRSWHAVRLLQEAFSEGPGVDEDLLLLFARAEAGWQNWAGVLALLEGSFALETEASGEAWYFLGRALEGRERWEDAEEAYTRVLDAPMERDDTQASLRHLEARARRAGIRGRLGSYGDALSDLEAVRVEDASVAGWVSLRVAERAAEDGAREETRAALSLVDRREVLQLGWNLLPRALLACGDSIGAEAAFWSSLPTLDDPSDRAEAWSRVGVLRLSRGDTVGAKGAFHQVLGLETGGARSVAAAEELVALGFDSLAVALAGARTLASAGLHRDALAAYAVYEGFLEEEPSPSIRLATARSHLALGQAGRALALATDVGASDEPDLGGPALALKIQALRQLARGGEARDVQDELVARFPERSEAVEILYARADNHRSRGNWAGAVEGYRATVALNSSHNLAGQARMQMGQIFLASGDEEEALAVYLEYLESFPDGRRWDEAAYWAGRVLRSMERESEARNLLDRLRSEAPLSYYSVRAGELVGEPFEPPVRVSHDTLPYPGFLREGMARFDRLRAFGLEEGAAWEAGALAERLRRDPDPHWRQEALLRLARELNARGFTREGINLGWELQRDGRVMDTQLLAAVYPFPYREILVPEAREQGVDPFLLAGLIRQESAFWVRARSRADARGLMQVLPSTGRELARVRGPRGFDPDDHLFVAEINIHLGVGFFTDMRRRFGEDLPLILSAYNAGPTRATRWRRFPEAADMPRFVERIPFTETRGYVKNVTRNRAIYTWLYGAGMGEGGGPAGARQGRLP